jgi:hypothetical protein
MGISPVHAGSPGDGHRRVAAYTLYVSNSTKTTPGDTEADANVRTVQEVFRLWVTPELERRRDAGLLTTPYVLEKAQVVMNLDRAIEVRLNDEVKGVAMCAVDAAAVKGLAEGPVPWAVINDVAEFRLSDADPNAAHITILAVPGRGCALFFDFRYNGSRVHESVAAAEEFLATAVFAASQRYGRAFAENLFAATELTAKAMLLMLPFPELLTSKTHKAVKSRLNQHGRHAQNVDPAFVDLHKELLPLRTDARYVQGSVFWSVDEMNRRAAVVRAVLEQVKRQAPQRVRARSAGPR